MNPATAGNRQIPWFGVRKFARQLILEVDALNDERKKLLGQLEKLGVLSLIEIEESKLKLQGEIAELRKQSEMELAAAGAAVQAAHVRLQELKESIVVTEDVALLQESGVYTYRHPLSDAVAYEKQLETVDFKIKEMCRKDGGAILATTDWKVNGSASEGRAMIRDFSKLMLRAFNAEADNLVRSLKPFKLDGAIDRLEKVATAIERLGRTMHIRVSTDYMKLRVRELELTADFLQKEAEEKERQRAEKERLKEERKAQQEMERERARLDKERQHYANALAALSDNGDAEAIQRLRAELAEIDRAIEDVDYRAANIRAGYVYVISNVGSFGESLVKVGLTRRLDPMDRIRELSDASVPFNFDVHALFFSKDAVGIETSMHARLADSRVNVVNHRREFFHITPREAKLHLAELAGELLQFTDEPEALEYRQSLAARKNRPEELKGGQDRVAMSA
jgi:hypothetical protein